MRAIKFKAYVKAYNVIVDVDRLGLNLDGSVQEIIVTEKDLGQYDSNEWTDLQAGEFELLEYTGYKDKSGREIYEGDVVRITLTQTQETRKGEVIYYAGNACFLVETANEEYFTFMSCDICEIEVLGNKYENKELM